MKRKQSKGEEVERESPSQTCCLGVLGVLPWTWGDAVGVCTVRYQGWRHTCSHFCLERERGKLIWGSRHQTAGSLSSPENCARGQGSETKAREQGAARHPLARAWWNPHVFCSLRAEVVRPGRSQGLSRSRRRPCPPWFALALSRLLSTHLLWGQHPPRVLGSEPQ